MEVNTLAAKLSAWIQRQVAEAGAQGCVVGLSGGIDSAVVAGLCSRAFPHHTLGLIMSCHSHPQDAAHARLVADKFAIPVREIVLDQVYDALLYTLPQQEGAEARQSLAAANIKPRLRMLTLYYHANLFNYLVAGTGNKSELTVGYFTKYGDGGVDILPLGNLVKGEVRQLAQYLGVPQEIIDKPPSAGLWSGQTDEGEMGLTYADLDAFIKSGQASPAVAERIEFLNRCSAHKRAMPPVPDF